jgi:translation initiation factor IF-2
MSLGIMVTMNQRLDAETLTIVADEFGYGVYHRLLLETEELL